MRPRRKHLYKTIEEQKEIVSHLTKSVIELKAELIMLKRDKKIDLFEYSAKEIKKNLWPWGWEDEPMNQDAIYKKYAAWTAIEALGIDPESIK
jgi:hypothetical protein